MPNDVRTQKTKTSLEGRETEATPYTVFEHFWLQYVCIMFALFTQSWDLSVNYNINRSIYGINRLLIVFFGQLMAFLG